MSDRGNIMTEEQEILQELESSEEGGQQPEGQDGELGQAEERAKRLGWRPKEEYNGDPNNWVDADTFVKKGEEELPLIRDTNRKLERKIGDMEKSMERMKKFTELQIKSAKEKALEELRLKNAKAVEEEEITTQEAFNRYEQGKQEIEESYAEPKEEEDTSPKVPQEVEDWVASNPWFTKDYQLNQAAQFYERQLGDMPLAEKLEEVKKKVMQDFPNKFSNPKRRAPQGVEGGGGIHSGGGKQGITVNDLSADDRRDAERLIRSGDFKDMNDFLKDYNKLYGSN